MYPPICPAVRIVGLFAVCLTLGCGPQAAVVDVSSQTQVATTDVLGVTIDYLFSEQQFAMTEIEEKVSGGLSRWISADPETVAKFDWLPDPLLESLPPEVKPLLDDLASENFKTSDAHYLQGQIWLKSLAATIVARPVVRNFWPPLSRQVDLANNGDAGEDPFAAALQAAHPELSADQLKQLVDACKLFDWTIRNVLLLERTAWPSAQEVDEESVVSGESKWPPSCGVAGPGYQRFNWQLLLYGRGDDLERGRIFAQLAHQRNIDVVQLALKTQSDSYAPNEQLTPWINAVVIGEHLFLFDTRLGLPIPSSADGRIATMAEMKANPELLKSLDLSVSESTSDDSNYWLQVDLASPVVALIDAPLESLSKRMAVLERNLTGAQRVVCSSRPSQLAERLKSNPLIQDVRLFSAEFYVHQYRDALLKGLQQIRFNADIAEKLFWMFTDEEYVDNYVRLRTAKNKYFLNKLESPPGIERIGAKEMFSQMIVRYTDDLINNLQQYTTIHASLGLHDHLPALEFQQRLEAVKNQMRLVRGDANYFLSLCHLESDNPSTALIWLKRVSALDNRDHWKNGVPYLQGRSQEMLNEFAQAIARYEIGKDDEKLAPQTHGNLIRARLLKQLLPTNASRDPKSGGTPRVVGWTSHRVPPE